MQKIIVVVVSFLISGCAFAQTGTFTVSGHLPGLDTDTMNLDFKNDKGERVWLNIPVENGSFKYTGEVAGMKMMTFWPKVERTIKRIGSGYVPAKSSQLHFVAFPGADIKFSGEITDFVNAYPGGDPVNEDLAALNRLINPLMNKSINLSLKIPNRILTDSADIKSAMAESARLDEDVYDIKIRFIKSHPASPVSAWYLQDMMLRSEVSNDEALNLYEGLEHQVLRSNPFFSALVQRIEGIRLVAVGKEAPAINSNHTYDGKPFKLASLKGKYVVLDFWGTWCGPCISGMPKMKEYRERYKDKMEIVGIAQESDDGSAWRGFLDKQPGYHWPQILNRTDDDFVLRYNVAGFPTKIIVDKAGVIVGRFVGEDETIYKKLDDLLK